MPEHRCGQGDVFGELALPSSPVLEEVQQSKRLCSNISARLYNCPRAASVEATEEAVVAWQHVELCRQRGSFWLTLLRQVWQLDRETFSKVLSHPDEGAEAHNGLGPAKATLFEMRLQSDVTTSWSLAQLVSG